MRLINRFRTVTVLIVLIAFFGFVNLSVFPASDMSAGVIEQTGTAYHAKKSPIVPILIGVVVVGAVAAVLILVVFKTKYDPRGDWVFKWRNQPSYDWNTESVSLTGERTSGTVIYKDHTGTYSLDGKTLKFQWTYENGNTITFIGEFTTEDTVTGTYTSSQSSAVNGQFELTRTPSAASLKTMPMGKLVGESGR